MHDLSMVGFRRVKISAEPLLLLEVCCRVWPIRASITLVRALRRLEAIAEFGRPGA